MASNGKLLQPLLELGVIALILVASAASKPNSSCDRKCGKVEIPYPFGTSEGCYLDKPFLITCNTSDHQHIVPLLEGHLPVEDISVSKGELRVSAPIARRCEGRSLHLEGYDFLTTEDLCHAGDPKCERGLPKPSLRAEGGVGKNRNSEAIPCSFSTGPPGYSACSNADRVNYSISAALLSLSSFRISETRNKITAVGCDIYAYIQGQVDRNGFTTGCLSLCDDSLNVVEGSCSGIGCCQTSIPNGATGYTLNVRSLNNDIGHVGEYRCGFSFIVDEQAYKFSPSDFRNLTNRKTVPLVLDWAIGNKTCEDAQKNKGSYACKATHSDCYNSTNGPGYRCNCSEGYLGNPYIPDHEPESCQDIDECKDHQKPCNATATCTNTDGNYKCTCPKGYEGDGRIDGTDCRPIVSQSDNKIISIALGVSISLLVLLVGSSWVYWGLQKRKLIKLKEKWFQQNGGLMLQQRLQNHTRSMDTAKIFRAEELEKATDNYNKSRVLGQGGYGTVYRGVLQDSKVVAIKKSKISDQSQIEQFINEVIVLTQINHRNVVKLLGCCLETEVPLLVYEFITNGTLSDHIHDKSRSSLLSWDKRLKIATETAGALTYLHCEASMPIIHRDVKTANILLDDNHIAKVSDFGASRLVPLDQTQLTTLVQGTFGYLDPEYFHTSHLTDKSDVYSFGVVLAELLTGKKVISFDRLESERNLATYFVSMVEEDRLLEILDDHIHNGSNVEEIKKVANVAIRSLCVKGDDRPTMKEVALELDGLRVKEKHLRKKDNHNTEEGKHLVSTSVQSLIIDVSTSYCSTGTIDSTGNETLKPMDDGR